MDSKNAFKFCDFCVLSWYYFSCVLSQKSSPAGRSPFTTVFFGLPLRNYLGSGRVVPDVTAARFALACPVKNLPEKFPPYAYFTLPD
jgi:hypothetical protein